MPDSVALDITHNDSAAPEPSKTNDPSLAIVKSNIFPFEDPARKNLCHIQKIETSLS
jgi:hypothetical protein